MCVFLPCTNTETLHSAFINLKNTRQHQNKSRKQGVATCTPTSAVLTYGYNRLWSCRQ